jgi:hypothetical protein
VIVGTLIGPAPVLAEPDEVEDPASERVVGHVARGDRYHVWDEDPREVADWTLLLGRPESEAADLRRWRSISAQSAALRPFLTDDIEAQLEASSRRSDDGATAISPLGHLLCLLPSLDRTALIAAWATSPSEETRRTLARALSAPFDAVGLRSAIDHLAQDPSPEIRRLAHSAHSVRRG